MRDNVSGLDPFMAKKRRLSQWLLFVLAINIFLQFDFVENWLSPSQQSHETHVTQRICGFRANFKKPESPNGGSLYSLQQINLSSVQPKVKLVAFFANQPLQRCHFSECRFSCLNTVLSQSRPDQFSGLSPPLV